MDETEQTFIHDTRILEAIMLEVHSRLVPGAAPVTRNNVVAVLRDVMHQARTSAEKAAELQDRIRKASADLVG